MTQEKKKEYLKRLKVDSLLDLVLYIPKSYNDTRLSNHLMAQENFVCEAVVLSSQKYLKRLQIDIYLPLFDKTISTIYFKYSYYHLKAFQKDANVYLQGKLEFSYGKYTLIQPKIIKEIGKIEPKYGLKSIKDVILRELMRAYVSKETLREHLSDEKVINELLDIHFPTSFIKNFSTNQINAIKYLEIFNFFKKMSKKRVEFDAISKLDNDPKEFIKNLPFKLTDDQKDAINQISVDFRSSKAARRVIVGDVGCGKSVVAFAATFMAYPKRSILMAPTSVLANQLYMEAKKFLPSFIRIGLVTNKSKPKELDKIYLIIGTHALLYDKNLPHCDLVMIDEQHRFGTNQRDFLKNIFKNGDKRPHFLQFSATPIPRTLAMIESSLVDITMIKQIPIKKDIKTKIISKSDFSRLKEHIDKELEQNMQVAIIYPLVEQSEQIDYQSIDEAKEFWLKRYKNVYIVHGKSKDKDNILKEFDKNGKILLATTVVEVGISLSRLSTIVIVGGERLGLSTLHQLRGRVARNVDKGWCFLYTNNPNNKRLQEFSKLISGFDIAELDLKYRKSGDLLSGKMQSGVSFNWIDLSEDADIVKLAKGHSKASLL